MIFLHVYVGLLFIFNKFLGISSIIIANWGKKTTTSSSTSYFSRMAPHTTHHFLGLNQSFSRLGYWVLTTNSSQSSPSSIDNTHDALYQKYSQKTGKYSQEHRVYKKKNKNKSKEVTFLNSSMDSYWWKKKRGPIRIKQMHSISLDAS